MDGGKDEQPYDDLNTINLVIYLYWLELLIVCAFQPETIARAEARISGREKSEPVVKKEAISRMPTKTSSF